MKSSEALHSAENVDRRRLILSLAGAALISAVGFGMIFLFVAWLIPLLMMWSLKDPHSTVIPLTAFLVFIFSLSAIIRVARKRRSARKERSNPKRTILSL
jgi:cation transporter-like permease